MLNRTLRWISQAIEYEPDQRHADLIAKEMGLENARPLATPAVAETKEESQNTEGSELANDLEATKFRSIAARLNYLSLDRPDLQYAAKGVARCMAKPRKKDWLLLKRVGRYLKGACRMVQRFEWQTLPSTVAAYTDSDWAGDRESRKSTSGGLLMLGKHFIKSWSSTQKVIALSSGEAELYALLKGATQAKGLMSMLYDWNIITHSIVNTDATAVMGIAYRQGLGKTRHMDTQYLWIQKEVRHETLKIKKARTDLNPADILTKGLKEEAMSLGFNVELVLEDENNQYLAKLWL